MFWVTCPMHGAYIPYVPTTARYICVSTEKILFTKNIIYLKYFYVSDWRKFPSPRLIRQFIYGDCSYSFTLSNASDLFFSGIPKNHIQVQKEKENLAVACLHPPKNVKLGIFPVVDPGAVSRVGIDGGESFQERTREPLGCYSYRSSSTTHSNVCLWIGGQQNKTKQNER